MQWQYVMTCYIKLFLLWFQGMKATTRQTIRDIYSVQVASRQQQLHRLPAERTWVTRVRLDACCGMLRISQSNFLFRRKWMDFVCRFWHISNVNEWSTLKKDEKVMPVLQKDIASFFGRLGHCNTSATPDTVYLRLPRIRQAIHNALHVMTRGLAIHNIRK